MNKVYQTFLILFLAYSVNAQDKILPSDFGYNNKVKQVEEVYYKYSPSDKRYNINEEQTLYFANGKLTQQSRLVNFIDVTAYDTYYTYNAAGQLLTCVEKVNGTEKGKYTYSYKNGKLMAKNGTYADKKEETLFTYNLNGQLEKITFKKDGELISTATFTNYKQFNTYTKTTTNYFLGKVSNIEIKNFLNGLLVEIGSRFGEAAPLTITKFTYDSKGNKVTSNSEFANSINVYEYDDGGNAFRALLGGVQTKQGKPGHVFRFSKITYTSGMSLGTTDLNYLFVNRHEKDVASYKTQDRLKAPTPGTQAINLASLLNNLTDSEINISVIKNADGSYKVMDGNKDITADVARIKAPNNLDLLVYDSVFEETVFFKDFYAPTTPVGKSIEGEYLPESKKGAYFVTTNAGKSIYVIYNGNYVALKDYKLVNAANGIDLNVQKDGLTIYILKNYYHASPIKLDVFYPIVIP